jgi:hypothetical protein
VLDPIRGKSEMQVIILLATIFALWTGLADPASAQIVTPSLFPPPCSGSNCINQNQGAKIIPQGAVQAQRGCPQGTMFDPRKGTCKVLPPVTGTP